jgi:hypothetical protein
MTNGKHSDAFTTTFAQQTYYVTVGDISHYEVIYHIAPRQYITCRKAQWCHTPSVARSLKDDGTGDTEGVPQALRGTMPLSHFYK